MKNKQAKRHLLALLLAVVLLISIAVPVVGATVSSGIFHITDSVKFTHKLFKEYCAAYYLFTKFPFRENQALYISLIQQDKWKEVFIFIAGMFADIYTQDEFLDFIMQNNLRLYVECMNAKSDLYDDLLSDSTKLALRYAILLHCIAYWGTDSTEGGAN